MRFFTHMKGFCLGTCFVLLSGMLYAQDKGISGNVSSAEEGPLPGVNVLLKGTTTGTVTDLEGNYRLSVPEDGGTLVFSSIGYANQEVEIGNQSTINVTMAEDVQSLSEVVVIGYGTQEARDATGAISSVKAEDFNGGVIASPEQLIQGRSAGVQITNSSGEPGAGVNIRIRGTSSVRSNNNPLFVVDGVPLAGDNVSSEGFDVGAGASAAKNPLNFLNPNDIASIDILKDASATAIYGSRGANGVVLITTKKGSDEGGAALTYAYNIGVSNITKRYNLLGRDEFISAYADINNIPAGDPSLEGLDLGADTDWQDQIFRTAISQNHYLAFGGSDDNSDYRFSLGYTDQNGIVEQSGLQRITARFNGSRGFINERLNVSTQLTVSNIRDENIPITDNAGATGDLLGAALKLNPTYPVYQDGELFQRSVTELNPVAFLELSRDNTNTVRTLGSFTFDFKITDDLSFKTVLGGDLSTSIREAGYSGDLVVQGIVGQGRFGSGDITSTNTLMENYFTYSNELSDVLQLDALLGYSYQRFQTETKIISAAGFRTTDLDIIMNNLSTVDQRLDSGAIVGNSSFRVDELQSVFGRVNLSIADKYLLTATLRADGSTRFGANYRYGYFPSFSAAWRLADEEFVPEAFDDLKLRVGYGITGNQEIPSNRYTNRQRFNDAGLSVTPTGVSVNNSSLLAVAFENPNLKWESTTQINVGLDYGFFDNRLRGSIDYYRKNTNDLLLQRFSAQPAPNDFNYVNIDADVINEGVEFTVEANAVNTDALSWNISANVGFNDNRVENFDGTINTGEISGQGLTGAFAQRIANNQPLFAYFLRPFGGFDDAGQSIYPEGDVQQFVGRGPLPTATAGFTNNLTFGPFDLSIFFNGQFGQYVYNNTANAYFTAGALAGGNNVTQDVIGNGESRGNAPDVSTRFLEDASFVRLQNLTLGYNFDASGIDFLSSFRLYVTGQNLFVITNYSGQDPEVSIDKAINDVPSLGLDYTAYPKARTVLVGLNVSF